MLIQNVSNTVPVIQAVGTVSKKPSDEGRSITAIPLKTKAAPELPVAQLQHAVEKFNNAMKESKQNLEFSVDTETKKPVIKLVDSVTGELIRQIPSKEMLAIARSIDQFQQGMLLSHKA